MAMRGVPEWRLPLRRALRSAALCIVFMLRCACAHATSGAGAPAEGAQASRCRHVIPTLSREVQSSVGRARTNPNSWVRRGLECTE
eukprot:5805996-Prymnesium_polylepis.2